MSNAATLPANCPPRVLTRAQAAAYLSISTTKLDELVKAGDLAEPIRFGSRIGYDRLALDRCIDRMSPAVGDDDVNPFD